MEKCEKLADDRRRTPSDGKSSLCLWQGELKKTGCCSLLVPSYSGTVKATTNLLEYFRQESSPHLTPFLILIKKQMNNK
jgi:hypothetical protein